MKMVSPTEENLEKAARFLQEGKLIGMPTETVYGIAANALDEKPVAATFAAKGRPEDNPLIVHVAGIEQAKEVAREFPHSAEILAKNFWPGPLTLVLPKAAKVPRQVTAGLDTVAVRMPAHPVALALITRAGFPLSAPSANRFMSLSPTSAQMIDPAIANSLELILDGGPCQVGIESTVLDLTEDLPRILRPGAVTKDQIELALGIAVTDQPSKSRRSPGMYPKHYAPSTPVKLVARLEPGQAGLTLEKPNGPNQLVMPNDAAQYAHDLYQSLFDLDQMRIGAVHIQAPPQSAEWNAVWDRLLKIIGTPEP